MSSQTLAKLREALDRCRISIDEPLVVYLLVQVRKLLQSKDAKDKFSNLKFHCDWILHSKLSWQPAQRYLAKIDKLIGEIGPEGITESTKAEVESLARFDQFIQELEELLKDQSLPTHIADDPETRLNFLTVYVAAIEGATLDITTDRLEHVRSLRVMSIPEPLPRTDKTSLSVTFFIIAPDGKPLHRWSFKFAIEKTP